MDKLSSMGVFVKVAEANSFKNAANQMGISYSVVTRSIANLEKHLGVKLLERTTQSVALTNAGSIYLDKCRNLLGLMDSIESDIAQVELEIEGVIKLGLLKYYSSKVIAQLLTGFVKNHTRIRLEIVDFDSYSKTIGIESDLVVLTSDDNRRIRGAQLLGNLPMTLVASPDYVTKRGQPKELEELTTHACLNLSSHLNRPAWYFLENNHLTEYAINPYLTSHDCDILLEAVLGGLGIACIPQNLAQPYLDSSRLVQVLTEFKLNPLSIYMLHSAHKSVNKKTQTLIDYLKLKFNA
ncbi:MAG: LysR family transcriptional regulator [Burkholderiales bacterium]|nr:LysR family transcriptional regulator [Burkholderiales bacterium]